VDWIEVIARLVLAGTFVVAGVAKLRDRDGLRESTTGLGVPASLAPAVALGLPWLEIGLGLLLLSSSTAPSALVALVALLVVFTVALTRVVRRGEEVACRCFGEVSSEPVGPSTVLRNVGLLALAGLALVAGGDLALVTWLDARSATEVAVLVVALAGLAGAASAVRRRSAERRATGGPRQILLRDDRLPEVLLERRDGTTVSTSELLERPAVLIFVSDSCGPCGAMKPDLARWQQTLAATVHVHVITDGAAPRTPTDDDGVTTLFDPGGAVQEACRIPATPSALAVDQQGRVTLGTVSGAIAIEALLRSV